jgi:hypothetical protein
LGEALAAAELLLLEFYPKVGLPENGVEEEGCGERREGMRAAR